jgi:hypothetical protein
LTFGSAAEAQKCIAMNGATMGERWLKIESYVEKPKQNLKQHVYRSTFPNGLQVLERARP